MPVAARRVEVRADVGQVRPVQGPRVQVDAVGRLAGDLGHEGPRQARCQGALGRAGEAAVEVAPVRQVAGLGDEAVDVDHRHSDQGAAQLLEPGALQQASHDLDPVDLVAVDGGADEQARTRASAVDDVDRQGDFGRRVAASHRDRQGPAGPGRDDLAVQLEGFLARGHDEVVAG